MEIDFFKNKERITMNWKQFSYEVKPLMTTTISAMEKSMVRKIQDVVCSIVENVYKRMQFKTYFSLNVCITYEFLKVQPIDISRLEVDNPCKHEKRCSWTPWLHECHDCIWGIATNNKKIILKNIG